MRVDDLRAFLVGKWCVTRRIADRRSSASGEFAGEAEFSPVEDGLRYDECGSLTLGGYRQPATRAYVYSFDDRCRADVWFDDGGYFHPLDLSDGRWRVRHVCADDVYEGAFRAHGDDHWTAVWSVCGPRKRHVIRSRYRRSKGKQLRETSNDPKSAAVR